MSKSKAASTQADLKALEALQADVAELEHIEELLDRYNVFEGMPSWRALMMRWNKAHPDIAYDNERLFHRDFFRTARSVVRPYGSKQGRDSDEGAREPWEREQATLFTEREGHADVGRVYYHPAVRPPTPEPFLEEDID